MALESLIAGRGIIASDINPYAVTLTKAKISPPQTVNEASDRMKFYLKRINPAVKRKKSNKIPKWIKVFFHPKTLQELIVLSELLQRNKEYFLLSCLLGILHHQRPGFLSYPASHLVPYLRSRKFPKEEYPELYKYRDIAPRLEKKSNEFIEDFLKFRLRSRDNVNSRMQHT